MGVATPILSAVQEINTVAKTSAVRRLRARLGPLEGKTIGVWGLTFKGGTEDTRESPAMEVVGLLRNEGALVHAYDPAVAADHGRVPVAFRPVLFDDPVEAVRRRRRAGDPHRLARVRGRSTSRPSATAWPEGSSSTAVTCSTGPRWRTLGFAYLGVGRVATAQRRRRSDL